MSAWAARWEDALARIDAGVRSRVLSDDVLRALRVIEADRSFGPVALERVARLVEACPVEVRR